MNEIGPYLASLPGLMGTSAGPSMSILFPLLDMLLNAIGSAGSSL